jgi:hypothetical protein
MTHLYKTRLLTLMCLLLSVIILVSCDKDDDEPNSGNVVLLNFGPTGAQHGDTLRFFGINLHKVTEIQLTNAVVPQSSFISQNKELILITVPESTEEGFVTLKTQSGDVVSKTRINFDVVPVISSVTSEARPGENITLKGNYLNWITGITFPDDKVVTTFVSQSVTELVVKVPDDAQTGTLVINYSGTKPLFFETDDSIKVTLPVITAFATNPVLHAANLTITGTNLDLTRQVLFTGAASAVTVFESQSPTELVVKVPAETRKGKVTLVAQSEVISESAMELDVILPAITTMSPNPIDPGDNITITGTNLQLVNAITFENKPAVTTFVSQSATQIVATVPMGVLRGKVTLGVVNSTLKVQSGDVLEIIGDVPPPTVAFPIYDDAVTGNWNGWIGNGWGGTSDRNNSTPVRAGTKSVRINYEGGYGSPLQLGGANVNTASYTSFKISVYGGPGSAGKRINIGMNGADKFTITLVEGKWTDYSIPLTDLITGTTISEILVKEYNGSGGFTIYVDAMGLN